MATVENGGVPGYSTFQGRKTIAHALESAPSTVILAYLVRDAEAATIEDAMRPWTPDLWILRALRPARTEGSPPSGATVRVPAADYVQNIRYLIEQIENSGADARVLAFPMVVPPADHLTHLSAASDLSGRLLIPTLPRDAFFARDPVHLTVEGNQTLAVTVADWLRTTGRAETGAIQ